VSEVPCRRNRRGVSGLRDGGAVRADEAAGRSRHVPGRYGRDKAASERGGGAAGGGLALRTEVECSESEGSFGGGDIRSAHGSLPRRRPARPCRATCLGIARSLCAMRSSADVSSIMACVCTAPVGAKQLERQHRGRQRTAIRWSSTGPPASLRPFYSARGLRHACPRPRWVYLYTLHAPLRAPRH
jgi:hypothetical protein